MLNGEMARSLPDADIVFEGTFRRHTPVQLESCRHFHRPGGGIADDPTPHYSNRKFVNEDDEENEAPSSFTCHFSLFILPAFA
jgi:hypothetical protein